MDKKLIIANWKARKTTAEATSWLDVLKQSGILAVTYPHQVILAAPFTLLSFLSHEIRQRNLPLRLSSQDVSSFSQGSFTGEVPAELIKEFSEYVIIGHSERREMLHESEEMLGQKVEQATVVGLSPIFCVQNETENIPANVHVVAYEPPGAIGSGKTAGLEGVVDMARTIKGTSDKELSILYGGSVDSENIKSFMEAPELSGVLVGTKSIEATDFISLLSAAV